MGLKVRALATLKAGKWLTEAGNRNEGALRAKGGPNGARLYFRYRNRAGTYDDLPIGTFDESGKRGLTLDQARTRTRELRQKYLAGNVDLRAAIESEKREAQRLSEAAEQEAQAAASRQRATLGALLTAYVEQLRRDGKASVRSVEQALKRHVADAWPSLWNTPISEVTADDLLVVVARLANANKLREGAKVRSYLRAAFGAAIRARQDARGLPALRELKVTTNPARDLVTIEGSTNARERALSVAEVRAYWRRILETPDPSGALLRFHLLTGGQRVEQLGRITVGDYDSDLQSVRLRDGKGRRKVARIHDVPLIPEALKALKAMRGGVLGPYLFTVTAGESGAVYFTVQHRLREIVAAMADGGELEKGPFTVGDLRRTVETRLAARGVAVDVRSQLQSHGLGGIQARHYDRHHYLDEKRSALKELFQLLTGKVGSVTTIKRKVNRE